MQPAMRIANGSALMAIDITDRHQYQSTLPSMDDGYYARHAARRTGQGAKTRRAQSTA